MHLALPRPHLLLLCAALALGAAPAMADKPDHAGGPHGQHKKEKKDKGRDRHEDRHGDRQDDRQYRRGNEQGERHEHRSDNRQVQRYDGGSRTNVQVNVQIGGYFNDVQRRSVVEYYEPRFRAGHCPPGLAKKRNGCMPPGQAKKWHRGAPLPREVVYYAVPQEVSVRLGGPPPGYRYVRVATDILLIAIGTGMVIDAVEDLSRW